MTTDNRKVQLGVAVDATGAKAGFDQVKADAKDMAQAVAQAGQQGAKGLDGIGAGAEDAAQKLDRSTRTMIGSVQRATVALESGGRGTAKFLEAIAKQRGADLDALKPYLDELRKVEAAQQAASGSLNKMGMSAAATSAALRNVPAQFTDIVVSLQSGQAPLTVLLQQGGQLKDMFGGVGGAAKALGGYVAGLVNPFTIAVGVVGALGYAANSAAEDTKALDSALILTSNKSGTTRSNLSGIAASLADTGIGAGTATAALVEFVNAGIKADDRLQSFTRNAIELERVGGPAVEKIAKEFADLAKDPLSGLDKLTLATYKQIEALLEQGDKVSAVKVAQDALNQSNADAVTSLRASFGPLDTAISKWKSWGAEIWNASRGLASGVAGAFAPQTGNQERAELQARRDLYAKNGYDTAKEDARLAYFKRLDDAQKQTLANEQKDITLRNLKAEFDKNDDGAKRLRERNKLIADNNELLKAGEISQRQYNDALTAFDAKNAKSVAKTKQGDPFAADRSAAKEWAQFYESFTDLTDKAKGKVDELSAAQLKLQQYLVSPAYSNATEDMRQLVLQQGYAAVAAEQLAKSQADLAKSQAAYERERAASLGRAVEEVSAIERRALAAEDEVRAYGLGKEAIDALAISRLQEQKVILMGFENAKGQIELIDQEIAARQRLAKAQDALSGKQEAQKAAKAAADEWKRAAEKINDSITDALIRGFESSKSIAENARDAIANVFKTLVLRPGVEFGVRGGLSVLGLGGASGAASAAESVGGIGNIGNSLSTLSSLGGLGNWLTDFGSAGASAIIKGGQIAYDAGFETIGRSMMSLSEAGNFSAVANGLNVVGDGLGYLNAAMAASKGQWGRAAGSAIGTWFGGPIGGAIGDAVGSWVDESFSGGHEYTTGTGIAGKFSGKQFSGRNFQDWRNEGSSGFFGIGASGSSSGTNYSAIDAQQAKFMGAAYGAIITQTADFATALGASASSITGYQKDIKLALGADAEANKKAVAAMFKGLADEVAATVLDSQYIREGEGAADTLARLATNLSAVNGALDTLGDGLLAVSQYSGSAASALVDNFGGLGQYQSAIAAYYQRYYSQDERTAKTSEQLTKQFAGAGIAVPGSTEDYRALVNAQDLATEAGRKTYAMLIGLSGAFADVSQAAQDAAKSAIDAAKALIKSARYGSYVDYAAASAAVGAVAAPRFAGGGDHYGGVRIVGENGPEFEATGAARIWNKSQMAGAMLSGSTELAARIDALRDDTRAQARSMATLQARMVKLLEVWDAKGMPEVRTV